MYPGGVNQSLDLLVPGQVGGADVMSQVEEQLPAQHLVTVHVGDIFHLRLRHLVVAGLVGELQDIEGNTLDRGFRQGVEPRHVGTLVVDLREGNTSTAATGPEVSRAEYQPERPRERPVWAPASWFD